MSGNGGKSKINRKRVYFLFILFLIAFGLISYRLFSVQYLNAEKYKGYADFQHTGEFNLQAKRGKILDRNQIELAVSLIEKSVYANPGEILDAEYEGSIISGILGIEEAEIIEKLKEPDKSFVYIQRKVSSEIAEKIAEKNLPGIYIIDELKRYYPLGDIAAPVIGFTGTDDTGLNGIELQFEDILRGINGKTVAEKDVFGNIIPGNIKNLIEPIDGRDIVLTIDSQIQFIAQEKLKKVVDEYSAEKAVAIVMNANSGEIYAMASYPGFDLNYYQDYEQELYKIPGISFTYEPGSTFKIVNISTALENDKVGKDQVFSLPPSIKVGDRVIKEIFRTYATEYSTSGIIQNSSNVGAVTVALAMGEKLFYEGMEKFGFGKPTGIELPGEEKGILHDYNTWPSSTIGALAIGQSISVTPLQLLRAVCSIANGGYLVKPSIVLNNGYSNLEENSSFDSSSKILTGETASAVGDMMLSVVEEGTGTGAQIEGVKVCGKTGTAEKANKNGVGYSEGRVITSFVGYAPYENPEIAVIVIVDEPHGNDNTIWGGTVAAPIFKEIMEFSLRKLMILP